MKISDIAKGIKPGTVREYENQPVQHWTGYSNSDLMIGRSVEGSLKRIVVLRDYSVAQIRTADGRITYIYE